MVMLVFPLGLKTVKIGISNCLFLLIYLLPGLMISTYTYIYLLPVGIVAVSHGYTLV